MGGRIQKIINSPKAQRARDVTIHRLPDESATDWARFLEEVAEAENVRVQHIEGSRAAIKPTCEGLSLQPFAYSLNRTCSQALSCSAIRARTRR